MTLDLAFATHESFAPHVGQLFALTDGEGAVVLTLRLEAVKLHGPETRRDSHLEIDGVVLPPRQAFSLTFEGPRAPVLAQGSYRLENAGTGPLVLFLSPFRQDRDATLYESAFS